MPRQRTIKPGFFSNEHLAECSPLARLLFAGLWCWADREGYLEDRPRKLRAEVLPYDVCDGDALLQELESRGFVERCEVDGNKLIRVANFTKHQDLHPRETPSKYTGRKKAHPRRAQGEPKASQGVAQIPYPSSPSLPSLPSLPPLPPPLPEAALGTPQERPPQAPTLTARTPPAQRTPPDDDAPPTPLLVVDEAGGPAAPLWPLLDAFRAALAQRLAKPHDWHRVSAPDRVGATRDQLEAELQRLGVPRAVELAFEATVREQQRGGRPPRYLAYFVKPLQEAPTVAHFVEPWEAGSPRGRAEYPEPTPEQLAEWEREARDELDKRAVAGGSP